MYKNIYCEHYKDSNNPYDQFKVHIWDDREGHIIYEKENSLVNYGYKEVKDPKEATHRGLNGEYLKYVENWKKRIAYKDHKSGKNIVKQEEEKGMHYSDHYIGNVHTKFLIDKYGIDGRVSDGHREVFFDIEIEIGGALTPKYIRKAPKPITSIAWWDKQLDEWAIVILDKTGEIKEGIQDGREIIPVRREQDLLDVFFNRMYAIRPDILVGYNSDYFDIPYIYYRTLRVFGKETGKHRVGKLSPLGSKGIKAPSPERIRQYNENGYSPDQEIIIAGCSSLDYFRLHKKYSFKQEPSMKLDFLGEKYVGQKKIEYNGSLDRLFVEDKQKFIEYNFIDVLILKKLDEKFQYLDLTKNLAHKGNVKYEEVYYSSKIHDGAISGYLLSKGIVPPNKERNPITQDSYAGGYLFCPKTGIFNYMFDEDLTSLYPSIIMTNNIGRETLIGKILSEDSRNNRLALNDLQQMDPNETYTIQNLKREQKEITVGDIIQLIKTHNLSITANGVLFETNKPSTLSVVLNKWFDERVTYKNAMKKAFKAGNKEEGQLNHLRQYTMKILLNSLYGATALPSFRYGSVILSEAITLTGQRIIQDSGTFINQEAEKTLQTGKEVYEIKTNPSQDYNQCLGVVMYEDTDSCYVNAEPLLRKLYPTFDQMDETERSDKLEALSLEYEKKINEYYNTLAPEAFNVPVEKHRLEMKTECTIRSAFFSGKRRYAQYITKKEGVPCNEIDVKGLDFMKSNFPPVFKEFFESILNKILFGETREKIDNEILEFKNSLEDMSFIKLAKPTGVKGIEKYVSTPSNAINIFSEFENKAPVGVKAAVRYNDLLKFKKLNNKHTQIVEGDKIKWVYLKDNPYKIDTIGFLDFDLPKEIQNFIEQYVDRPKAFDTILRNKLESFYQDLDWGHLTLNTYVQQFFKF
jgi:DNA polymerase elongation subunit (family B)